MAKTVTKDQMQRDAVKLSYIDYNGRTSMVVQYKAGFSLEKLRDKHQSEEPIYVAFEGEQPEELANVLEELRRYRTNTKLETDKMWKKIEDFAYTTQAISDELAELKSKKKWWRR